MTNKDKKIIKPIEKIALKVVNLLKGKSLSEINQVLIVTKRIVEENSTLSKTISVD